MTQCSRTMTYQTIQTLTMTIYSPPHPPPVPPAGDGRPVLAGRARWLKKADAGKKKKDKTTKAAPAKPKGGAKSVVIATGGVQVVERALTEEEVNSRLEEVVASRGRKGTDPRELLRKLEMLSRQASQLRSWQKFPWCRT